MKIKLHNIFKKKLDANSLKITSENIAEHRKEVLAAGRKFKYPVQISGKKIVFGSAAIALVVVSAFSVYVWHNLYRVQNTAALFYNAARVLPLPVARVDGESVRFDAYLRLIRADIHYYITQERRAFNSKEGSEELNFHKRNELRNAERAAYARKVARQMGLKLTDQELQDKINADLKADSSTEETLVNTLKEYYGWSMDDYRSVLRGQLLERKVAFALDTDAKSKLDQIQARLQKGDDFATVAREMSDDADSKQRGGAVVVTRSTEDPTGVLRAIKGKQPGTVLPPLQVKLADAYYYYIVRFDGIDKDEFTDKEQTKYSLITVRLSKFDHDFKQLIEQNKITEYIAVPREQDLKVKSAK